MAVTKQARRAIRVSGRKQVTNLRVKREMKDSVKEVRDLVKGGKTKEAQSKLDVAYKKIDKAAKRGIIHKNTASRKKEQTFKTTCKK